MKRRMGCLLVALALLAGTALAQAPQMLEDYVEEQLFVRVELEEADLAEVYAQMEAYVAGGNTAQTADELFRFYRDYATILLASGQVEQSRPAVENLLRMLEAPLYEKGIAQMTMSESEAASFYPEWYVSLLGVTDRADDLLIAAMDRVADFFLSYLTEVSAQTDPFYELYRGIYEQAGMVARATALVYGGDTDQALALMDAYLEGLQSSDDEAAQTSAIIVALVYEPFRQIHLGNAREAAQAFGDYLELMALMEGEPDEATLRYHYIQDLNGLHSYEMRGIVASEVCRAYVASLPKRLEFRVVGAPEGFAQGDRILAIDGVELYAPQQMGWLMGGSPCPEFTLLRDGQTVVIKPQRIDGNRFGIAVETTLADQ